MEHDKTVVGIAFSGDDRRLITGSYDTTVRIWDLADSRNPMEWARLTGHRNSVESVASRRTGCLPSAVLTIAGS